MSRSSSWIALRGADSEPAAATSDSSEDSLDAHMNFHVAIGASDPSEDKADWSSSIPLLTSIHNHSRASTAGPRTLLTRLVLLLLPLTFFAFILYSCSLGISCFSNIFPAPRILSTSSSKGHLSVCEPPGASGTNNSDAAGDSSGAGSKEAETSEDGDSKLVHKPLKEQAHGAPPLSHTLDNVEARKGLSSGASGSGAGEKDSKYVSAKGPSVEGRGKPCPTSRVEPPASSNDPKAGEGSPSGAPASASKTSPKFDNAGPPSVKGSGAMRPKASPVTAPPPSDHSEGDGTATGASGSVAGTTDPTSANANPPMGGSGATPSVSRMPVPPSENAPISVWLHSNLPMEAIIQEKLRRFEAVNASNRRNWNKQKNLYRYFNIDGKDGEDLEDDVFN